MPLSKTSPYIYVCSKVVSLLLMYKVRFYVNSNDKKMTNNKFKEKVGLFVLIFY